MSEEVQEGAAVEESITEESTNTPESTEESRYEMPETDDLFTPQEDETSSEETETTSEESATSEEETPVESEKFTIDGKEYQADELQKAIEFQSNMDQWNQTNTQRAQENAEERKRLEEISSQVEQLKQTQATSQADSQLSEEARQTKQWLDQHGYVTKELVDNLITEKVSELQQVIDQTRTAQASDQIVKEVQELTAKRNITEDQAYDVAQFALDNKMEALSLDDVYVVMNKDKILTDLKETAKAQAAADNKKKAEAGRVLSTRGATSKSGDDSLKYNPKTDRNKSWHELAEDVSRSLK